MAEYHVKCSPFHIYAGTPSSENKNLWQDKNIVTGEAICAVRDYMFLHLLGGVGCAKASSSGYEWIMSDGSVIELNVAIRDKKREAGILPR